jgi:hypothetical protein
MRAFPLYLLLLLALLGCRREDDPKASDPCEDIQPANAHFEFGLLNFERRREDPPELHVADTMYGGHLYALAAHPADTLVWTAGEPPASFVREGDRLFGFSVDTEYEGPVKMKLVSIKSHPRDTACLHPAQRRDTVERTLHVLPRSSFSQDPIYGTYRGTCSLYGDEVRTVTLSYGPTEGCNNRTGICWVFDGLFRTCSRYILGGGGGSVIFMPKRLRLYSSLTIAYDCPKDRSESEEGLYWSLDHTWVTLDESGKNLLISGKRVGVRPDGSKVINDFTFTGQKID